MDDQIHYATQILTRLIDTIGRALPGVVAGLIVMVVFIAAAILVRRVLRRVASRVALDKQPLVELGGETIRYVGITIGLITGLGTMGIDVSALIAGLGLTGFALGFALRDAVSNLIAGVLILVYQPYGYGDEITVAGNGGTVVGINFRYTVLRSDDGDVIHVPNSTMFNNAVRVASQTGEVR